MKITSLDEKLVEKAVKYVEDNISRSDLSVEELSRELGMSLRWPESFPDGYCLLFPFP